MFDIRPLTGADLDDAMGLSRQAGWNQLRADWERLLALCPEGCFAGTVDDRVVATTTVLSYGDVSWIGMVLVDEDHRSQGYGSRIFEHGLEYALEAGGPVVGLDATHLGEPIYESYGFERVAPVFRWQGSLRIPAQGDTSRVDAVADSADVDAACEFDRRCVGTDRTPLLRALLSEPPVRGFLSRGSTGVDGYVVVRPGRTNWQIGPLAATDSRTIAPLLRAVSGALEDQDVIVDAPDRDAVSTHLEAGGLSRDRELVRMTYPEPTPTLHTECVRAFVDFAFG